MKATQKNFQSLLLNDYKSVKMRFDFVYDYPRPFSNTKYQKNGQKKWWLCVPAGHASNPIYYIKKGKGSFWHSDLNEWVKPNRTKVLL